jgi:integral membrane sensor domain MASE1
MGKKILAIVLGGLIGFSIGTLGGGFLGLVIGGTFFGWIEVPNYPYMPGYELAAYIGIILGILILTPLGVIIALKIAGRSNHKV